MSDEQQPAESESPTPQGGRRRGRSPKRHVVARVLITTLVVLGMVTGLSVVFIARHLSDNLTVLDPSDQLSNRPDKVDEGPGEPLNILVMGSDSREGAGNNIDGLTGDGARSDTTILMHLSADREHAYGVSIPRDSLVTRPDCEDEDGNTIPGGENQMWNTAFALGGPACTIQQFEQLTDVRIDHFVVVDFAGFRDMVDAIDGVEVCIPEDIEDPAHGINIPAGTREIRGKEALNYVRARYTLGDGSDIGRIQRQQAFVAAMAKKVVSGGTLARLDRVVAFLDAATKSLIVDPGLKGVFKIGKLGLGFRGIGLDNIKFLTVPWAYDTRAGYEGRVVWRPDAQKVWRKVREDEPLTKRLSRGSINAGNVPGSGDRPGTRPDRSDDEEEAAAREAAGLCA
ncbi:LCP family protein [Nocardioides sp. cx-173]|uniref:LCP family protein n=1 Tax=Nocardioides sp. cx-173 TaxID=2898796 RepID=UPI001E54E9B2|nr:LCP family protein [Nocardioides sp. cx-173]MCD4526857.1 LCP family protein [Nocardioides sp. cx-173]UGB41354.1 LCP family protein [Nocardioides sp. cx-173]